ncbi:Hypothetical protein PENO1_078030 [Penicillium occitanis (nom. inval.)]|nr:Hypothetical protein PENO1_078030 [Penicillium occitanis (nom. inval.)]PCG94874.1 hypothetical protein PENOC_080720 [Penicillium occitanis (nom. inval.)]
MGLHKITDPPKSQLSDTEQWHEVIETEIGKRVWCQLMIQDHFGLCFTDSYNINPNHCLTELPKNADDHDLEELDMNVPTITSYMRTLAYIAKLIPRRFDKLGPLWSRKPLIEQYRDVLLGDHDMRQVLGEIPTFLRRGDMTERTIDKPWLDLARRSLAITAAEKIILIHRPFLFLSFQTSHYPHTRSTCVSAATTIVREYSNIIASNHIALWEHSTYCVTASIILCLEVLYPRSGIQSHGPAQNYHDLVKSARELLAGRRGDIIANRGARLIDTMLSVGGIPGSASGSGLAFVSGPQQSRCSTTSQVRLDLQDIVSQFLQGDMLRMDLLEEEWSDSLATDLRLDIGPLGQDFGTWFEGLFGPGQVRPSVYDYLRQP